MLRHNHISKTKYKDTQCIADKEGMTVRVCSFSGHNINEWNKFEGFKHIRCKFPISRLSFYPVGITCA